jgi:hypothetical protein
MIFMADLTSTGDAGSAVTTDQPADDAVLGQLTLVSDESDVVLTYSTVILDSSGRARTNGPFGDALIRL